MNSVAETILLRNIAIFDSQTGRISTGQDVLIEENLITAITPAATDTASADTRIIDGRGGTLIPGLIDAHWHAVFATMPLNVAMRADPGYIHLLAGRGASETLLRGFTTVRDAGGPSFGLKAAIDDGVITGPRIFPSGAMISQSGGHGDFRAASEVPRGPLSQLSHAEVVGAATIVDGPDGVLRASREQLMLGATQLKLMAGGGAASSYDPIDVTQYTEPELNAAVEAAASWGTYVMVHAYTPRAVQQAIRAGVSSIEHGQLVDEATVAMMAEHGTWWSLQPFLDDQDAVPVPEPNRPKQRQIISGTDTAYALGRKHGVKIGWGTDTLFAPWLAARQGAQLAKMTRWYSPAEVLTMATATNAELLNLSGPRNPYPSGALGTITQGALADLVLIDGNPLEDISLLERPNEAFQLIMKDGQIVKNTIDQH